MQLWLVLLGSALTLFLVLVVARVQLDLDVRAIGQPDGVLRAAGGAACGPLALTAVHASHTPTVVELHAFGRRFDARRPRQATRPDAPPSRGSAAHALLGRDPLELLDVVLELRHAAAVDVLDVDLNYGFRDVALTGKLLGAIYALSALLPRGVRVTQNARWDGEEAWDLAVRGRIALWPGRVLVRLLWYMLRRRARGPRRIQQQSPMSVRGSG
ncbi:MAG TPA: hypothetical protein VER33_26740 [Polyangiaceae bacterium]|nr:hypothetical protein [Polyangiaceae bacterium]